MSKELLSHEIPGCYVRNCYFCKKVPWSNFNGVFFGFYCSKCDIHTGWYGSYIRAAAIWNRNRGDHNEHLCEYKDFLRKEELRIKKSIQLNRAIAKHSQHVRLYKIKLRKEKIAAKREEKRKKVA